MIKNVTINRDYEKELCTKVDNLYKAIVKKATEENRMTEKALTIYGDYVKAPAMTEEERTEFEELQNRYNEEKNKNNEEQKKADEEVKELRKQEKINKDLANGITPEQRKAMTNKKRKETELKKLENQMKALKRQMTIAKNKIKEYDEIINN